MSCPPRERIEVWADGGPRLFHSVRFTSDAVSGVATLQPPECDTCRVSIPLETVDSMRTAPGEVNAIAGVLAPVAVLAVVLAAWGIAGAD